MNQDQVPDLRPSDPGTAGQRRPVPQDKPLRPTIRVEAIQLTPQATTPGDGPLSRKVGELETEVERLREAEQGLLQSNDALQLLSETANELLSSEKPQEVISTLFQKLSARLGLEAYFNYLVDEEKVKLHLNSYAGIPPETARDIEWLEYGQAVCGCVARDACRIVAEDIQHSDDVRTDLVRSFGIKAYACHPLIARGRVIGTFSFGTSRKPYFDPHELALMQAVCDQVSLAMERILLIAELRRKEAAQRLLAEAGGVLASSLDYEFNLASFAELAVKSFADWCVVDLAEGVPLLRRVAAAHTDPAKTDLLHQLTEGQLVAPDEVQALQRAVRSGEAEAFPDLSDPVLAAFSGNVRLRRMLRERGVRSALVVPLAGRHEIQGVITFVTAESGRSYGAEDLALAKELAYRVAIAIENARLYRQTREAVHARDEFLSAAAHELKTPVTSLRGFAQTLLRKFEKEQKFDEDRLYRALQVIDQRSERMAYLVSQLMDVSRIDAGQLVLNRQSVELGEMTKGVVENNRAAIPWHDLAVHVHEPIWIVADRSLLEQVLRNLLDNAVKYSPEGSKIDVDIWSPEISLARVAVRDRGPGIPPEQRDRIFDRFSRAHATDHSRGMGLGLHISQQIAGLHGGKIEVEYPSDGGTRFIVSLPTALAEIKRRREEEQTRGNAENTGS